MLYLFLRLNTINLSIHQHQDSTCIVSNCIYILQVLDAGEVKEFDEPYTLLQDPNSLFSHMVQMTGPGMAKQLREVAHSAYMKNSVQKGQSINVFGGTGGDDVIEMNGITPVPPTIANGGGLSVPDGHVNDGFEHTEMTYL